MGKPSGQLHEEKQKRINAAGNLEIPERVPVTCNMGNFPAKYTGALCSDVYYNYDA